MTRGKKALIFGVCGQDGGYLARSLHLSGYEVHGTSRNRATASRVNLRACGMEEHVPLYSVDLTNRKNVSTLIEYVAPTEIYNLAGQSSVGLSFDSPMETFDATALGTLNILQSLHASKDDIRFYNAGSSECFGNTTEPADEQTPFQPRSPYGVAKSSAHWMVCNYREAYGLYACSGILFNHESPLRPARFVTRKIIAGAVDILQGRASELRLGNLSVVRDWGWAPEYVEAMQAILSRDKPDDYVIATGHATKLEDFVARAFSTLGMDWREYVVVDAGLARPLDISYSVGNPGKAERELGWRASTLMPALVDRLLEAEMEQRKQSVNG